MLILNTFVLRLWQVFGGAKHSLFWFDDATMDWSGDLSDRNLFFCLKDFIGYKNYSSLFHKDLLNPLMDIVKYDLNLMQRPINPINDIFLK